MFLAFGIVVRSVWLGLTLVGILGQTGQGQGHDRLTIPVHAAFLPSIMCGSSYSQILSSLLHCLRLLVTVHHLPSVSSLLTLSPDHSPQPATHPHALPQHILERGKRKENAW